MSIRGVFGAMVPFLLSACGHAGAAGSHSVPPASAAAPVAAAAHVRVEKLERELVWLRAQLNALQAERQGRNAARDKATASVQIVGEEDRSFVEDAPQDDGHRLIVGHGDNLEVRSVPAHGVRRR